MSTISPLGSPVPEAFSDVMQRLSNERRGNSISVVILGAGPAGLMQAIVALANGNEVTVLEKRAANEVGRIQVVMIDPNAKKVMEDYGIYQCLADKGAIGPSPFNNFAFTVSIRDIQEAMKKVIEGIVPGMSVISYETSLDQVDTVTHDLIIKTNYFATKVLKAPNYLIIAEGANSKTLTHMLGGRRIEVLNPQLGIGGVFKDRQSLNKSFRSENKIHPTAWGLVLSTPGNVYAARFPTNEEKSALQTITSPEERTGYINERLLSDFFMEEMVPFKPYQSPEDILFSKDTYMRSSISSVFCGALSPKTHFFVTGDALLEIDVIVGAGCNTVISSAPPLIALFQKNLPPAEIMDQYEKDSKNLLLNKLKKAECARVWGTVPYDNAQVKTAIELLKTASFISDGTNINHAPYPFSWLVRWLTNIILGGKYARPN